MYRNPGPYDARLPTSAFRVNPDQRMVVHGTILHLERRDRGALVGPGLQPRLRVDERKLLGQPVAGYDVFNGRTALGPFDTMHLACGVGSLRGGLHMLDSIVPKLRTLDLGGLLHQPGEIIRHASGGDRAFDASNHEVGGFGPPQVAEHHLS